MNNVIIGSGVGGLATAIRLASRGEKVIVLEKAAKPGGKLGEIREQGFRFDAGPSLFTLPHLIVELLETAGVDPSVFPFEKLDRSCHYFWEDGTKFTAWANRKSLLEEVESTFGVTAEPVNDHLDRSDLLYRYTSKLFMERSLHKIGSFLSSDVIKALVRVHKLNLGETMDSANQKKLNHPKLVQLFNRYATYNGSDPYRAPGVLNIIPHLEHNIGTFFPQKGMHQITETLFEVAKQKGVEFKFNEEAVNIAVKSKSVTAVETEYNTYKADRVISNADVVPTYRHLLKGESAPEKTLARERSSSALIFYWGINKVFDQLHLHNILFAEDYQTEFAKLFEGTDIHDDPTVYINITSKCQPEDAPKGMENWFVMINVPANKGQDWDTLIKEAKSNIYKKINRILNTRIEEHIVFEEQLDPISIEQKTSSFQGALYGTSSNDKMAAFFRHPNFSKKIDGLYFCGGSVHPGGGIPLCLLSAKIIDDLTK